MKGSRRGRIVRMLEDGKQEAEILAVLNREFPPGTFKTTHEAALRGTKRDLGMIEKACETQTLSVDEVAFGSDEPFRTDECQ